MPCATLWRASGELRLTTDDLDYFQHMEKVTAAHEGFSKIPWPDDPAYPQTDFEKRFRAQGLPIHRLLLSAENLAIQLLGVVARAVKTFVAEKRLHGIFSIGHAEADGDPARLVLPE